MRSPSKFEKKKRKDGWKSPRAALVHRGNLLIVPVTLELVIEFLCKAGSSMTSRIAEILNWQEPLFF